MRVLGYPPGWLNIADMSKTVVPIHDGDGEVDVEPDPTQEATYNLESLVVYPGFNAPLPQGVNDVRFFNTSFQCFIYQIILAYFLLMYQFILAYFLLMYQIILARLFRLGLQNAPNATDAASPAVGLRNSDHEETEAGSIQAIQAS